MAGSVAVVAVGSPAEPSSVPCSSYLLAMTFIRQPVPSQTSKIPSALQSVTSSFRSAVFPPWASVWMRAPAPYLCTYYDYICKPPAGSDRYETEKPALSWLSEGTKRRSLPCFYGGPSSKSVLLAASSHFSRALFGRSASSRGPEPAAAACRCTCISAQPPLLARE